jgi:cephalosporin-C deacetylase-like acetyl esterase
MNRFAILAAALSLANVSLSIAQDSPKADTRRGDQMLAEYFSAETKRISDACLAEIETLADWNANKVEYRRQLLEMLGLDPLPERTDLKAEVTGRVEHEEFFVENLHFQSRPGLYVTGNLYVPKNIDQPLPAILYVCGHGAVKKDGVSFGNKVTYQHHGAWFARNGYVCLTIDTLQMGEIEGIHHGTHRYGMWWWLNRGYTPAGVEAWNCVRALDYLETRPEVDKSKFGVTGRSGGGAYSWWIAAIDDRIKAAVPVAGITDLENHVVDGCVEGHCDCMYMVNTYRWDYAQVAALVAPRPLLISNTDSDGIFPLDGVVRTFEQVRRIYRLHEPAMKGAAANVALNISPGPHKDTQELQLHAFRWFDKHLKGQEKPIEMAAVKFFQPEELKVFRTLPADEINTKIHETFVAAAEAAAVPDDRAEWESTRSGWVQALHQKSFRAWGKSHEPILGRQAFLTTKDGITLVATDFTSDESIRLRVFVALTDSTIDPFAPDILEMKVLDEEGWRRFLSTVRPGFEAQFPDESLPPPDREAYSKWREDLKVRTRAFAYITPRGIGATRWEQTERKHVQRRRRFYLLGQTLEAQQARDVQQAIRVLRSLEYVSHTPLSIEGHGTMAGVALYGSLFEPNIQRLDLYDLPKTHRDGPIFLNVSRYLDMPQAVAMAAERSKVVLYQDDDAGWDYPQAVAEKLGWDAEQIQIRRKPK